MFITPSLGNLLATNLKPHGYDRLMLILFASSFIVSRQVKRMCWELVVQAGILPVGRLVALQRHSHVYTSLHPNEAVSQDQGCN